MDPTAPRRAARAALLAPLAAALLLAACGRAPGPEPAAAGAAADTEPAAMAASLPDATPLGPVAVSRHEGDDDLLSAGLGLAGLRAMAPPAATDPLAPSATELRRMAFHANWRGIADLTPGGGLESVFPELPMVPGEEHHALIRLEGRNAPHRVVLQLPDGFDAEHPCIVVAPASGSRGVYGAIAVAGPWALPRGCALVMTDKGAGTDVFDPGRGTGAALDGSRAQAGGEAVLAFVPPGYDAAAITDGETRLALRHAHSQDNPEADWGLHALQALRFALDRIGERLGRELDRDAVRVLGVAVSNGGGALLQAVEAEGGDWFDAVVAGEPNAMARGARSLYDYATQAALLQPCALLDPAFDGAPFVTDALRAAGAVRCRALAERGLLDGDDDASRAADALARLRASGWSEASLSTGSINVAFDLWRAVAVTYASAYARAPWDAMPCGYGFVMPGADGRPMAPPPLALTLWWALGSGIPPGLGIAIADGMADAAEGDDKPLPGLLCLRALVDGEDDTARALQQGIAALQLAGEPKAPSFVVHGRDDGLVPPVFSSRPWAEAAIASGATVRYHEVDHAQHFDAFLGVPGVAGRYVPLLPVVWQQLDQAVAWLDGGAEPAPSQRVRATPGETPRLLDDPAADAITLESGTLHIPTTP